MRKPKLRDGDIVELYWWDSCGVHDIWVQESSFDFDDHTKAMFHKTVGYFIKEDKEATYISLSRRVHKESGGASHGHLFAIPNCAIANIRRLGK